jgi:methyl-accepting chemotaxis protein
MTWTIRKKLLAGFLLVSALTLALGVVSVTQMRTLYDGTVDLNSTRLPSAERLGRLRAEFNRLRTAQLGYLLAVDDDARAAAQTKLDEAVAALDESNAAYAPFATSADERAAYAEFDHSRVEYVQQSAQMVAFLNDAKWEDASGLMAGDGAKTFDAAVEALGKGVRANGAEASAAAARSASTFAATRAIAIGLLAIVVFLAAGSPTLRRALRA